MPFFRNYKVFIAFALLFLLAGCSLAGDITPPPNYIPATQAPADASANQPASQQTVYPLVPPDPAQGAAIYVTKCQPCHGTSGMGDGPMAPNLPNPVSPLGAPDFARMSSPMQWFQMVTNGNIDKGMPPFAQGLTDRQRWDVVAYATTLSVSKEEMGQGKTAYEANCAACHGQGGLGDGPQAASLTTRPVSWVRDQSRLVQLSPDAIVEVATGGLQGHPNFSDKLDTNQRYAVAAYVRSLSFANASIPVEAAAQAQETPAASTPGANENAGAASTPAAQGTSAANIRISGQVTNGTPGGKLPADMKATLLAYSGMDPAFNESTIVSADGKYNFDQVKFDPNYVYIVRVDANGVPYNSDIIHAQDVKNGQAELPVKIYDSSTDTSKLKTDRLHVFFDFSQPNEVQVVTLFVITNPTDRVIIPAGEGKPVVQFDLPAGATKLQFQDGTLGDGRYIKTEKGFGDATSIVPGQGQHQVLFAYNLPYPDKLDFNVKTPLPTDAAIVMVPPVGVKLKSDQLADSGSRDVQGMAFQMYQSKNALQAGSTLSLSLTGKASEAGTAAPAQTQNPINYLLIGGGTFGLVLAGAGLWMYLRMSRKSPVTAGAGEAGLEGAGEASPEESSEALLDAIVALDDLHASGKLPEPAYQQRRADLKARLADAMIREKRN